MKRLFILFVVLFAAFDANADNPNSRVGIVGTNVMAGHHYYGKPTQNTVNTASISVKTDPAMPATKASKVDTREAERNACINNNIGVGNTFVWASRYSNTANYASMVEDVEHPENNICFVKVELKSDDPSRISVADVAPKYFMWGEAIGCGNWVDEKVMEKRILEARKGARIGGIVASTVGGAGLGVGSMELFGNKLIGNKVEGQKSLVGVDLYRSQLLALKEKNPSQYNSYMNDLDSIIKECEEESGVISKSDCDMYQDLKSRLY